MPSESKFLAKLWPVSKNTNKKETVGKNKQKKQQQKVLGDREEVGVVGGH